MRSHCCFEIHNLYQVTCLSHIYGLHEYGALDLEDTVFSANIICYGCLFFWLNGLH